MNLLDNSEQTKELKKNASVLPIITYPHPILRQKTENISDPRDPHIQKLIQSMMITMQSNNGLGLAAPQVNYSKNLCLVDYQDKIYILINPKITSHSQTKSLDEEGCLSFPGKFLKIERYDKITVRYLDQFGKKRKLKASGLLARALQHEVDHLQGKLFIDYV